MPYHLATPQCGRKTGNRGTPDPLFYLGLSLIHIFTSLSSTSMPAPLWRGHWSAPPCGILPGSCPPCWRERALCWPSGFSPLISIGTCPMPMAEKDRLPKGRRSFLTGRRYSFYPVRCACGAFPAPPNSCLLYTSKAPLVSSVTGGPVPAYISVGSSKVVASSGSDQSRLQPVAAPL